MRIKYNWGKNKGAVNPSNFFQLSSRIYQSVCSRTIADRRNCDWMADKSRRVVELCKKARTSALVIRAHILQEKKVVAVYCFQGRFEVC